eukprot:UN28798
MKWWTWAGGSCTLYWNWDQISASARSGPGNLYQRNCPDIEWKDITNTVLENAVCSRIHGTNAQVKISDDSTGVFGFYDYETTAVDSGCLRCDIVTPFYFTHVRGTFVIDPTDPIDGSPQDPDDDFSISSWGERSSTHSGWFAFGTIDNIILPGNQFPDKHLLDEYTFNIATTEVSRTNTIRFEFTQSADHEDFIMKDINIEVVISETPTVTPSTSIPSGSPSTSTPTVSSPTSDPTTSKPTVDPTMAPTTSEPTDVPTISPTTGEPTNHPTTSPTTSGPTAHPTMSPSVSKPTKSPTRFPTFSKPTRDPTGNPVTSDPSFEPTFDPSTTNPTFHPSVSPTTSNPTDLPTEQPSNTCKKYVCQEEQQDTVIKIDEIIEQMELLIEQYKYQETLIQNLQTENRELIKTNEELTNSVSTVQYKLRDVQIYNEEQDETVISLTESVNTQEESRNTEIAELTNSISSVNDDLISTVSRVDELTAQADVRDTEISGIDNSISNVNDDLIFN